MTILISEIPNIISKFYMEIYAKNTRFLVLMSLTAIWAIFKWTLRENFSIFFVKTAERMAILDPSYSGAI